MVFQVFKGRITSSGARGKSRSARVVLFFSITVGLTVVLASAPRALAQSSGGQFEITRHTINNGGGSSSGSTYVLNGSMAQPEASLQSASGGNFQLTGGFWANGATGGQGDFLFSDGFEDPN